MNELIVVMLIAVGCYVAVPRQPQSLILTVVMTLIWLLTK